MIIRKCGHSKCEHEDPIIVDRENSTGAIFYNSKYYHEDCFIKECNKRLKSQKETRLDWGKALNNIPKLKENAKKKMIVYLDRDDLYRFVLENYQISRVNNLQWTKLSHIYDGTYKGLAYKISQVELLEEWKFYMPELIENRKYKNMTGEQAFNYDLAIVLSKNIEYREFLEKKKLEEQVNESQRINENDVNSEVMTIIQRNSGKQNAANRRADLFKEVFDNGDGGN